MGRDSDSELGGREDGLDGSVKGVHGLPSGDSWTERRWASEYFVPVFSGAGLVLLCVCVCVSQVDPLIVKCNHFVSSD